MNTLATYTSDVNGLTITLTDGTTQNFSYPVAAVTGTPSEVDLSSGQTVTIKAV